MRSLGMEEALQLPAAGDCIYPPPPSPLPEPAPAKPKEEPMAADSERYAWTGGLPEWVSVPAIWWHTEMPPPCRNLVGTPPPPRTAPRWQPPRIRVGARRGATALPHAAARQWLSCLSLTGEPYTI